jgi:TPR repeat protein
MWNYISDEVLAAELGCDPNDFYEEFHRSFQLYAWCGLIEVMRPRPGEIQLRYRLTTRGREAAESEMFFVDNPYLGELGAYDGAAWTAPEYADLEWAAEMFRSEAVLYLRRRRDERRHSRKAALKAVATTPDIRGGESDCWSVGADVGENYIRSLRFAAAKGHKNAAMHRDRVAEKMTSAGNSKSRKLIRGWRARPGMGSDTPMKRTLAIVVLCLLLITPAWAGLDEGVAAYDHNGHEMALREWLPLAESGDAGTQFDLGMMYASGEDVHQDVKAVVKWYRKAAELGPGELKNYAEAARWLRRADDLGDPLAHFNLGIMYYRGQGVAQNHTEAVSWFRKAAEQGHATAQTYLGLMYVLGWGVQQDDLQAHKWWSLAATKGNKQAQKNLDNIAKTIAPAQLAQARKLANEWQAAFNKRKAK